MNKFTKAYENGLLIFYLLLFLSVDVYSQAKKFAGTYTNLSFKDGPTKELILYDVNDTTLYFYMEACKGAPSYNSGSEDGIVMVKGDTGQFISDDADCILFFYFGKKDVIVRSKERNDGCGYGNGVGPDGTYPLTSRKRPKYFIDRHGDTIYFSKYNPKTYLK